jgi:hypothetical protein
MERTNGPELPFHFTFGARPEVKAEELVIFIKRVQTQAKDLGFASTLVLNASFDTAERRDFARRLTFGLRIEDQRLVGVELPKGAQAWRHDRVNGSSRLLPTNGVVLVVTDEQGCEVVFGFFQFPEIVRDINGHVVAESRLHGGWHSSNFVDSPDPRYREIVRLFGENGYLHKEEDEFAPAETRRP